MQTSDPDIYAVGDMVESEHRILGAPMNLALAGPANRQGRLAADHIFGKAVPYRGNVGTAVCKVFDLTVATTGFAVGILRKMGMDPLYVTVHPPDHAGYYPDAHQLTLKVAFEKGIKAETTTSHAPGMVSNVRWERLRCRQVRFIPFIKQPDPACLQAK